MTEERGLQNHGGQNHIRRSYDFAHHDFVDLILFVFMRFPFGFK